ncbi:MAG: CinA family nicotinamide mononucleotide deamidase-related protein [Actinobacteria bacterium]|nr:CinA family nicotinamide mononucleotide deamidase-related protein [Actinomycetota bacterium]
MKFSIISVGTEIILGLVINTNSKHIAEHLTEIGLECSFMYTAGDKQEELSIVLKESLKHSDIIIISGGLGPTDDDITRNAVASALNLKLVRDRSLDETSLKFLKRVKIKGVHNSLLRQSYVPRGSKSIKPRIGSASGFIINLDGKQKWIFCIPGVPKEMEDMLKFDVVPYIKKIVKDNKEKCEDVFLKKVVLTTTDISESEIEARIKEVSQDARKININTCLTATPGLIKIILVSKSKSIDDCNKNLRIIEQRINDLLGEYIYGSGDNLISDRLKEVIIKKERKITISVAESITGGLISSIITDTPGSSDFFMGSVVSYSDFAKNELLNIGDDILTKKGSVSKEVCIDMAINVKEIFNSDFAVGVTGFAGPGTAEDSKKVGLVFCGVVGPDGYRQVFEKNFIGNRSEIKFRTAQFVLNKLRIAIDNIIK